MDPAIDARTSRLYLRQVNGLHSQTDLE